LTRIPAQKEFFDEMDVFDISNNLFPIIPAGSLKFNSDFMSIIDVSNCGVGHIELEAFVGNISVELK